MLQRLSASLVKFKGNTLDKILSKLMYIEPNAIRLSDVSTSGMDITSILQELADTGGTLYQDTDYDVVTKGGVILNIGIRIIGSRGKKGKIILTSDVYDEIFNPHTTQPCFFEAEYGRFKATTCITNTPFLCGVRMIDARTGLEHCSMSHCRFEDIGCSIETKYEVDSNDIATYNHITLSKSMSDKIISTGRQNLRGALHTRKRDKDTVYGVDSLRYGSADISHNIVVCHMPTGQNQDVAKFSGFYRSLKVTNNHFHNTNLDSGAEVDTYNAIGGGVYGFNTHVNCSLKFMSLSNSGTTEYLACLGTSIVGNTLNFEEGNINAYGMFFKGDVSTATGNVIRNVIRSARVNFIALYQDGNRGAGGYLDSQSAVGLTFTGNVIDMGADALNGFTWRTIEAPSTIVASVYSSNIIKGGSIRKVANDNVLLSNNQLLDVDLEKSGDLLYTTFGNKRTSISGGIASDSSLTTITATQGTFNEVSIQTPWLSGDLSYWTLLVKSSSNTSNNWQVFNTISNPANQTIQQSSGRYESSNTNTDIKAVIFDLNISGGNLKLVSKGITSDTVQVTYKWVATIR